MADEQVVTEMDLLNERIERIRQRAYELWEQDGRPSDRADEYWLQAEQEVSVDAGSEQPASVLGSSKRSRAR